MKMKITKEMKDKDKMKKEHEGKAHLSISKRSIWKYGILKLSIEKPRNKFNKSTLFSKAKIFIAQ